MRKAFTLIEVMVAVLIISVVIMALFQMKGNSSHIFLNLSKKLELNQYSSFFISNDNYGFEKQTTTLDELLGNFKVEDELRQELKKAKIEVIYQELEQIDMSEQSDENSSSGMIFEIGKTILKTDESSVSLIRLRVQ
ncbi:MAG: prepilin-type N-terminal cleavage/methylation domain-containing protein [Sulfurimonas sp.]|nr:prepilin-type N-terminal cleavage/methylation domain-containing protein [Sulfurimonas sp.]MCK4974259.1 prepilin-type N-terminal cleavage/methylation domain-containing protein [Sulfurimonas sp.]